MITVEMDRASNILILRNIPEHKEGDLKEQVVIMVADALRMETEEMGMEIDQIYRVNSSYARLKECTM